jgi:hypothetical protein
MPRLDYSAGQVGEATRLVLKPGHLALQLPEGEAPIVTSVPAALTEYKISGADKLIVPATQDFAYDGINDRFYFSRAGAVNVPFNVAISQSYSQNASAAEITVRLRKNGTDLSGVYAKRTIGNANTVGTISIQGHFGLSDNDYLELVVYSTKTGDFNAWAFSASIIEEAQ